jgi:hypothetical protein
MNPGDTNKQNTFRNASTNSIERLSSGRPSRTISWKIAFR